MSGIEIKTLSNAILNYLINKCIDIKIMQKNYLHISSFATVIIILILVGKHAKIQCLNLLTHPPPHPQNKLGGFKKLYAKKFML